MTRKQLLRLEEGTLIVIHGRGMFGLEHKVLRFKKDDLWVGKHEGYYYGALYPFSWLRLATESDLEQECELARQHCKNRIEALKKAFELTKKARKQDEIK